MFDDENNRSFGLGDTGGVVAPNFCFLLQEVEIEEIVMEGWWQWFFLTYVSLNNFR